MDKKIIIAHRGNALQFPENSWLAIQSAIDLGIKYIECDVQLSKDKQPVLFHDRNLERLCQQAGALYDYDYDELITFSLSYNERFGDQFKGNGLLGLEELVTRMQSYPDVSLFVELKRVSIEQFGIDTVLSCIIPLLEPLADRCVIISYNFAAIREVRRRGWQMVGFVMDQWSTLNERRIDELAPEWYFCDINGLPALGRIGIAGTRTAVFEVGKIEVARELWQRGVDAIETFNVNEMITAKS